MIVGADTYTAIIVKIKAYEKNYRRFEGPHSTTNVEGVRLLNMAGYYVVGWLC